MDLTKLTEKIDKEAVELRRKIHQNPELSFEEVETTKLLEDELSQVEGLEIIKDGLKTGLIVILRGDKPGKTIALRADMDALPIQEETGLPFASQNKHVMHACGHDIHTSVLFGAAKVLSHYKDQIKGNIKFFFQPAEEKLGGAVALMKAGCMKDPDVDAAVAVHTWPNLEGGKVGLKKGPTTASADEIIVKVRGKGGHAAHPEDCIDPVIISGYILTKIQTAVSRETSPLDPIVVTVGTLNAGTASNIIPDEVVMTGTVRTVKHKTRMEIFDRLERIIKHTAISMGGEAELQVNKGVPPLVADENVVDTIERSAVEMLGEENVVKLDEPSMGGEDFAFYLENTPGAMIRLGTDNEDDNSRISLHNARVIFDERSIGAGIKVLVKTALNFLE